MFFQQFAGVLFVMFAAQLAGGIIIFSYKDAFKTELVDTMTVWMKKYNSDDNAKDAWDTLQTEVKHFIFPEFSTYVHWTPSKFAVLLLRNYGQH